MKFSKRALTQETIKKISALKDSNAAERGMLHWKGISFARQDAALQRRSVSVAHKMLIALTKAFPDVNGRLIGDVVADLDSLWDVGQKLDMELKRLFQMQFPQHRNQLREFLNFIEAIQIDMVEYWAGNLRSRVPKLLRDLDRQERSERHAGQTKFTPRPRNAPKQKRA